MSHYPFPKVALAAAGVFAFGWVLVAEQLPPVQLGEVMRENHSLLKELRASNARIAAFENTDRRSNTQATQPANRDAQHSQPAEGGQSRPNEGLAAGTYWGGLLDASFPDGNVFRHTVAAKIEKESEDGFQIRITFDEIEWLLNCVREKNDYKIQSAELVNAEGHYKSKAGMIAIKTSDVMIAKINGSYLLRINVTRPFESGFATATYTLTRSY
jgi:hypothetical protein